MERMMAIEKTIAIGDIHGTIDEFKELLNLVDHKSPHVRVILAGDLIDRGPASVECVALARELDLTCVLGNHDLKFLKWWKNVGSRQDVYGKQPHYTQFSQEDINYIARMPLFIKMEHLNAVVIHAGLRTGVPLEKQTKDDLCYLRYTDKDDKFVSLKKINAVGSKEAAGAIFWTERGPFGFDTVVYGHQVWETPRIDRYDDGTKCVGVDTGCCFGGSLTAYCIETQELVQVKAKRTYYQSSFAIR
jgi:bis(5'-nucleosyl)-tetraphosphatase (symmetrical)